MSNLVIRELEELASMLATEMVNDLARKKKVATSDLIRSIKPSTEVTPYGYEVSVTGKHYAKWVNVGRRKKAKKVPVSVLMDWIKQRGLESGNKKIKSLAFAIQTSIWKNGIEPTRFIEYAIKQTEQTVRSKVLTAIGFEVESQIDDMIANYYKQKEI